MRRLWNIGVAAALVGNAQLGCSQQNQQFDFDGDGWQDSQDCDPHNEDINPDALEDCLDDQDNDCDGLVDSYDDDCQTGINFSNELVFPDTVLGCEEIQELTLINDTDDVVVVESVVLINDPGALIIRGVTDPPWTLQPFSGLALQGHFTPSAAERHVIGIQAYNLPGC